MIDIDIPGFAHLTLEHLVIDYDGTLALDGKLLPGAMESLIALAVDLEIHVLTADTFGLAEKQLGHLPLQLVIVPNESQAEQKLRFVHQLGAQRVVAIGNGRNDVRMLEAAALGIALIQREGAASVAFTAADLIAPSFWEALELLRHPKRLIATLRS